MWLLSYDSARAPYLAGVIVPKKSPVFCQDVCGEFVVTVLAVQEE